MKKRGTKEGSFKKKILKDLYGMNFIIALFLGIGFILRTDQWFSLFIALVVMACSIVAYRSLK